MNNIESVILGWVVTAVMYGTIFSYAALGETINEKAGQLNLGVPGIMYLSAIVSFLSVFQLEKIGIAPVLCVLVSLLSAFLTGALLGLVYALFCVTFRCNQNVTGLAISSFGVGFGKFLSALSFQGGAKLPLTSALYKTGIAGLNAVPYVGPWLFNYGFLTYLVLLLLILATVFFRRTRPGLNLKAVGESPATADAAGINVTRYRYVATLTGCGLCGVAGLSYVMDFSNGTWSTNNNIEALGWLAVALVIFTSWKPKHLIWGAPLFGFLFWAYTYLPSLFKMPAITGLTELLQMIPYVVTILILIVNSLRKKKENQPPESLGLAYFREDR